MKAYLGTISQTAKRISLTIILAKNIHIMINHLSMAIAIATRDITIRTIIANSNPMIILLNHHTLNKLIPGILEISKTICRTSLILENIIIQPNHQVPMSLEAHVRLSKTHSLNMNPKIPNNMNITMNDKKKASRKSIGKTKLILLNMIHLN